MASDQRRSSRSTGDYFPKGVHEFRPLIGAVVREVDRSGKARAGDFRPFGFQGSSIAEVLDRVDLCDGGVINLPDEGLLNASRSALAREKREQCRVARVELEQGDRRSSTASVFEPVSCPRRNSSTSAALSTGISARLM